MPTLKNFPAEICYNFYFQPINMYSVIETASRDGAKEVSVVCSHWINNETVAWPKQYNKALKNQLDPNPDWELFGCKILKSNIGSYREAKEKEKFLAEFSNSEFDEEATLGKQKYKIQNFNENFDQPALNEVIIIESANCPTEEFAIELPPLIHISQETEKTISNLEGHTSQLMDQVSTPVFRSNCFIEEYTNENETSIDLKQETHLKIQKLKEKIKKNRLKIKETKSQITTVLENQQHILQNQADIKEILQVVVMNVKPKKNQSIIIKDSAFILPKLPFNAVEQLTALNSKLASQSYMDQMTLQLYKLAAEKPNKTVKNCLEYLCSTPLLSKYSWSGQNSLSKEINKLVFAEYINVVELLRGVHNYLKTSNAVPTAKITLSVKEFLKRSNFRYNKKTVLLNINIIISKAALFSVSLSRSW